MAEIKDKEELDAWLEGRPKAVSVVIAVRAALRVVPLQAVGFRRSNRDAVAGDDVLPVFRAVAEPWVAVKYSVDFLKVAAAFTLEPGHYELKGHDLLSGHAVGTARGRATAAGIGASIASATGTGTASGRTIFASAGSFAGSARADSTNAANAARAASKAADDATAARAAADAVVHAADAAAAAVVAVYNERVEAAGTNDDDWGTDSADRDAVAEAAAGAARVAIWEEMSTDASFLQGEEAFRPDELASDVLWDNETPDWAKKNWADLKQTLLGLDPDWRVWTDWYAARLAGQLTYPRFDVELNKQIEIARVMIAEAIWQEGSAAVFAEIKRLEEEILGREPPVEPDSGPGPDYALKAGKLAAVAHLPQEAESEQSSKLHKQLRKKAKDFSHVIGPAPNEYPELAEAATEYAELVDVPTDQLDVVAVWSVGGALAAFSRSYREQNESRTMASPLEPQLASKLTSLVRDHGAFILGFEEGRDLVERADRFALDADVIREIETPGNALLNELTDNSALVEEDTRKAHKPVRDAAVEFGWTTSRVGYSAYVIVRKAVYAMIKYTVGEGKRPGEIAAILVGAGTGVSVLAGDPSAEFIRAAVPVLRDHGAQLLSFFNHSPEFRAYVEWALDVLDDDNDARKN